MTTDQIIGWIIYYIVAYFLLKAGLEILIICISMIVVYYSLNQFNYSYENYQVVFPKNMYDNYHNLGYLPTRSHGDSFGKSYYYIPVHQYYSEKNYDNPMAQCSVPRSISEYCVDQRMQETGDLNYSISKCIVPGKISPNCV